MRFRDALRKSCPELAEYVELHVAEICRELDGVQPFFSEYTDHSVRHSERVLELAERLTIGATTDFEKALLILFSYYHDWGMVVSTEEYTEYVDSLGDDTAVRLLIENACSREEVHDLDPSAGRKLLALEHFRQEHAVRSARRIREHFPQDQASSFFGHGIYLWETLATLCDAHRRDIAEILGDSSISCSTALGNGVTVDAVFLVAVSRMADACHFGRDRALPFLKKGNQFVSGRSAGIWSYYADVADTVPNPKTHRIEISAKCEDFYIHRAIVNNAHEIQTELVNAHRLLAERHSDQLFDWKYVDTSAVVPAKGDYDYHDSRFTLNRRHIIELLMGNRLYRSKLYALRECIQNAVDAVTVYEGKAAADYSPCVVVDVSQDGIVDIYDNGTGMDKEIIDKHFLSVGESAFWYSDRGIREWGGIPRNACLIAEHGIGTLSYFMLADRIEIFSIYGPSGEHVHVMLDDYLDGVVFRNTPVSEFPSFDAAVGTSLPWASRHGSSIRMHLGQSVDPDEVLRFLGKHILRISSTIILRTSEGVLRLPEIWHLRSGVDDLFYSSARHHALAPGPGRARPSVTEVFTDLYTPKRGFYEGPPKDRAITENAYSIGKSHYRVQMYAESGSREPFRLSQNGIAVEDAASFFRDVRGGLPLLDTFTVDVDVRGRCFQLSANRAQISDNTYNRLLAQELMRAFVESYFEQVGKIEASVHFPCGGRYYHGMEYVLFSHELLQVSFHQSLKRFFQDQEANRQCVVDHEQPFASAHLYCVGTDRSRPISVREIEEDPAVEEVLVLRRKFAESKPSISETSGKRDAQLDAFMKAVRLHATTPDALVYIPGDRGAFVLPLALRLGLSVAYEDKRFRILRIHRGRGFSLDESLRLLTGE